MAINTRVFNKKRFSFHFEYTHKLDARKAAKNLRRLGFQARVVEVKRGKRLGYLVYKRK